jgi:hypothetical protein
MTSVYFHQRSLPKVIRLVIKTKDQVQASTIRSAQLSRPTEDRWGSALEKSDYKRSND